ncbi:TonB-dependent receptor [Pseudochryseolinea flava]|uniref:TonB-dependent siderophore receptor n=1 Tax=Pseudochryseolinea flava TaxID=2059302 RepID=A0A364Y6D8_9BACT|nr:TonB-dependent receptor [Pseudochryseolinea flava]RAW02439.1 TonB-dependent siderophore receptor [Pseudochryseolinea flava]
MRSKILLVIALLMSVLAYGQSNKGSLKGTIKTSDGQPAYMVSVALKGTSKGTTTNHEGNYEIKNIEAGTYTLVTSFVGLETKEIQVEVVAGKVTQVEGVELAESAQELSQVVVLATRDVYTTTEPSSSLRLGAPLIETPQNIQVVTPAMLKDQQVVSMSDGLVRNVSGAVRLDHWGDLYTNISSRGSQVQAFRNGFNVAASYWGPLTEEMSFVDHIEFVKGPAGFMLSSGDPSGLYNVVTKKPSGQNKREVSLTYGSFNLLRGTVDVDGKFTDKLLYRLNLAAKKSESHRDFEHNDRYVVAPVLSYHFSPRTKLTGEYTYQRAKMSDVGSYYVWSATGYGTYPVGFTMMPKDLPDTKIDDHSVFLTFEHGFNDKWKFTVQGSYFNYGQDGTSMWPWVVAPNSQAIRGVGLWQAESEMLMAQGFLNGEFSTGSINHRILVGVDVADREYLADFYQSKPLDTEAQPFDPNNPNYGTPPAGWPQFDTELPLDERDAVGAINQNYNSYYVQDELGFFHNKLRLTLAGRYTSISQWTYGSRGFQRAYKLSPRAGLSYSIDSQNSVYALYDQAFTPQNGRLSNGDEVKPLTGNNVEVGYKRDWFGGKWSTTIAAYNIIKENELTSDPDSAYNLNYNLEIGQKRSRGIEFDIKGNIAKGFSLIANYALTDSRVSKPGNAAAVFKENQIVPSYAKHVANVWLTYKISNGVLKGAGVQAGFTLLADRYTYWDAPPNGEELPTYFKLDGGIFWGNEKLKITANVFNILDEYLYSGSYYAYLSAFYYQTDPPRNARISVSYSF